MIETDTISKFGIDYRITRKETDGFFAEILSFINYPALNKKLSFLADKSVNNSHNIKISLAYADEKVISLSVNSLYFLNYSIGLGEFIPTSYALRQRHITKSELKKAIKRAGKGCKYLPDTTRFTRDGIRVNIVNTNTNEIFNLKIKPQNKLHQKS